MKASNSLTVRARGLRQQSSAAETRLWYYLRARRFMGCKFRRQVVIEPYIVDFVYFESKLVIEADGGQHAGQQDYDARRSAFLAARGYTVLRFCNHEILNATDSVLARIRELLMGLPSP